MSANIDYQTDYQAKHDIGWAIYQLSLSVKYFANRYYEAAKLQIDMVKDTQDRIVGIYKTSTDEILEKK